MQTFLHTVALCSLVAAAVEQSGNRLVRKERGLADQAYVAMSSEANIMRLDDSYGHGLDESHKELPHQKYVSVNSEANIIQDDSENDFVDSEADLIEVDSETESIGSEADGGELDDPQARVAIVCAKYNKDVSFLGGFPKDVTKIVVRKGVDCPNAANEATSYLTYIISNYNNLPDTIFFIHDEDTSWHHDGSLTKRFPELSESFRLCKCGYYGINNKPLPFRADIQSLVQPGFWKQCLQDELGDPPASDQPDRPCCAQFIVSRANVLQHPKTFYQKLYAWAINNTDENARDSPDYNCSRLPASSRCTGRLFEWSWSFIFELPSQWKDR